MELQCKVLEIVSASIIMVDEAVSWKAEDIDG
jgi:hypothetical protein